MKKIKFLAVFFIAVNFCSCLDESFELPEENSIVDENTPNALFAINQKEGNDWTVTFSNLSTEALYYDWDFGDGTVITTTELNKEPWFDYTFNTDVEKEFTITLTATDDLGAVSVYSQDFFVQENTSDFAAVDKDIVIHSYSSFQDDGIKYQEPNNSIDGDLTTEWTAQDGDIIDGDYKGDGEFIIYDLGSSNQIDIIEMSILGKFQAYGYEIYTSNTGVEDVDFVKIVPESEDIRFTSFINIGGVESTVLTESLLVSVAARYIKVVAYGRFENTDAVAPIRTSAWSNISEVNFFRLRN